MKVFIVEDDPIIIEGLTIALTQEGNEVESSSCMAEAMDKLQSGISFDICLLDVMLPDGDGYQICRTIRNRSDVPILFLTACDDEVHTVLALEQGADDYVSKPFRIRELTARMKAILRRTGRLSEEREKNSLTAGGGAERASEAVGEAASDGGNGRPGNSDVITLGGNDVNVMSGKVFRGEEEIFLSSVEYRLLLTFLRSKGQLLTRQQILNDMWDSAGDYVNDNTLTVYVKRLRNKLEEDGGEPLIETVRGVGYRMI